MSVFIIEVCMFMFLFDMVFMNFGNRNSFRIFVSSFFSFVNTVNFIVEMSVVFLRGDVFMVNFLCMFCMSLFGFDVVNLLRYLVMMFRTFFFFEFAVSYKIVNILFVLFLVKFLMMIIL